MENQGRHDLSRSGEDLLQIDLWAIFEGGMCLFTINEFHERCRMDWKESSAQRYYTAPYQSHIYSILGLFILPTTENTFLFCEII